MTGYHSKTLPPINQEEVEEILSISDSDIDYSDIPDMSDKTFYKAIKKPVNIRPDNDVIVFFKELASKNNESYQALINNTLRAVMTKTRRTK